MYRFTLSCKEVGFPIYKLKSFACKSFAVYFFLWGNGGPNWRKDLDLWHQEQEAEWTKVGNKKSYADIVRSPPKQHARNVFQRLNFPNNYHLNFLGSSRSSSGTARYPPLIPERVLRPIGRVLRGGNKNKEFSQEKPLEAFPPRQFLNSKNFKSPLSKSLLAQPKKTTFKWVRKDKEQFQEKILESPSHPLPDSNSKPSMMEKDSAQSSSPLCSRCLRPGHSWQACANSVRCNHRLFYGHKSSACLRTPRQSRLIWAVKGMEGEGSKERNKSAAPTHPAQVHSSPSHPVTPSPEKTPVSSSSSPPMANFAVDPRPHVPKGFTLVEQPLRPPLRHEVYVTGCYTLANED